MRVCITICLILSIALSGFSWAADSHVESFSGEHQQMSSGLDDDGGDATEACDHCCHGSAHQLGLASRSTLHLLAAGTTVRTPMVTIPRSEAREPPFRPPIRT
jgi:hypothetical protein